MNEETTEQDNKAEGSHDQTGESCEDDMFYRNSNVSKIMPSTVSAHTTSVQDVIKGTAGFYTKLNVWGSLGLNFEYDWGPIIEIGGPIFLDKLRILEGSTSFHEGSVTVVPRSVILRATCMFGPPIICRDQAI